MRQLAHHAILLASERERNSASDVRIDGCIQRQRHRTRARTQLRPPHHHAKLQQQELVEGQAAARARKLVTILRRVHGLPCGGQGGRAAPVRRGF